MQKRLSDVIKTICVKSPLLPVLVGILTVVSMFAANANRLGWGQLGLPVAFVTLWAVVCWALLFVIPRGRKMAGVLASVVVLVTMLWDLFPELPQKYVPTVGLIPLLTWAGGGILIVRFYQSINKVVPLVTAMVLVAILFSLGQATYAIAKADRGSVTEQTIAQADEDYPDIYFIIPDRFGSLDALRECGLSEDNIDWFVMELEDRGFYIREDAMSGDTFQPNDRGVSTTRTLRYLASVLNFGEDIDINIGYNEAGKMVRDPEVIKVLHSMGYTCYNVGSWYPETAVSLVADYNYVYESSNPVQWLYVQEFGAAVLDRSMWRYFIVTGDQTERDREMFQQQAIIEIAGNDITPKFTFAHILLPHPPFVWTADGEPQESDADDMTRYLDQVIFTECYLLEMIDAIPDDAIIIIQSDEGVCFTDKDDNEGLSDTQWNGVLMAWRIPGSDFSVLDGIGHTEILEYVICQ